MARTRNEWVLRFARSPEFLDVDPEAAISLDGSGRILGMTHSGAKLLARAAGLDWRSPSGLIGQPVTRFFDVQLDDLPHYTRGHAPQDRLIVARDGNALFAHAIEPNRHPRGATVAVRATPSALRGLDGGDAKMAALQVRAAKLARQGLPILLQGETGVGKEYLARAIHDDSRRPGSFVAVNCAAIPESLIESELFGYLPGAYTGAAPKGRKGLIEASDGGTLFLDEIGDMPLTLQSRLLRVLAEAEVTPIGANAPRAVRLSLVSASHRDLGEQVRQGRFREDLYYRINAATLTVPPLRERQDLDWLIARMLARHQDESGAPVLSSAALLALKAHAWPGNIRELANVIAVAAALCEDGVITPQDLPDTFAPAGVAVSAEEAALRSTLARCGGNVSEAARQLGVDRSTVHRQMRRYGLTR